MEDNHYPDIQPDGLGDLKEIKRLPAMAKNQPKIAWGEEYQSWPIEKRLHYAERLAASMNNAADVMQKERNELLELCKRQEAQLKDNSVQYHELGDLMNVELAKMDAEKQLLYADLVKITKELKEAKHELLVLKGND